MRIQNKQKFIFRLFFTSLNPVCRRQYRSVLQQAVLLWGSSFEASAKVPRGSFAVWCWVHWALKLQLGVWSCTVRDVQRFPRKKVFWVCFSLIKSLWFQDKFCNSLLLELTKISHKNSDSFLFRCKNWRYKRRKKNSSNHRRSTQSLDSFFLSKLQIR